MKNVVIWPFDKEITQPSWQKPGAIAQVRGKGPKRSSELPSQHWSRMYWATDACGTYHPLPTSSYTPVVSLVSQMQHRLYVASCRGMPVSTKISKDEASWQSQRLRIPTPEGCGLKQRAVIGPSKATGTRLFRKTLGFPRAVILGGLKGRIPIQLGMEGRAWDQRGLFLNVRSNGNCLIGFGLS